MNQKSKINLSILIFIIGLTSFILQLFVFEAPDGFLGFILCVTSVYLMMGSIYALCKLSKKFKEFLLNILDLLFFIR